MNAISSVPGMVAPFLSAELVELEAKWIYPAVWGACFAIVTATSWMLEYETRHVHLDCHEEDDSSFVKI